MFYYWDGYEIDGSDTDFDLVLPEKQQRLDFVRCFLSMPLLAPDIYIDKTIYKGDDKNILSKALDWFTGPHEPETKIQWVTREETLELAAQCPEVMLHVHCRLIEQLPEEVRSKLYSFSSTREPLEKNYGKVENPCMAPEIPHHLERGDMSLTFTMCSPGTKKGWYTETGSEPEGYVRNPELLGSLDDLPCFTLNCGPSFYYEYAMYIVDYLQDHFPGMAIAGGLDCAGGWTDGCTYANSIYSYECIRIPVSYSVRNTLKYLTQFDLLRSYHRSYRKGVWQYEPQDDFVLVNRPEHMKEGPSQMTFSEYQGWVEKQLHDDEDEFDMILSTAINVLLPAKERFRKNPEAVRKLEEAQKYLEDKTYEEWYRAGYFAFTRTGGQTFCEYRVRPEIKPYLLTLLELAEFAEIDFVKEETYRRRHNG